MYARITHFTIKPARFDDLVAWSEEIREQILDIPGMRSGYMIKSSENSVISVGIYDDQESAEKAQAAVKGFIGQMTEFLEGTPETTTGEIVPIDFSNGDASTESTERSSKKVTSRTVLGLSILSRLLLPF